ncbi:YdhK family protein [Staphylococcus pseudintermedius]|uniref:YdhK family protein n=1 Tax=Staphylococcus pseudintermedius TaxID=283734 RepID=UPI0028853C0B|nr:YdhK family protein [Staphylococcus pseudintermedius]MDT0855478.1 YdhK family protein [Staphylococcus pseudintermedius]
MESDSGAHMEHSADEMSSSGEVPEDLKEAENPTYEVGSRTIIEAEHMQGMDGAEATISGAFDTTVYMVDFVTTDTEEKVQNHKWVTESELAPVE